jgi:CRISPR-associated exonuclease Cas4
MRRGLKELTATDLKQWAYCPRIPYYRYVMPVSFVRTYQMERGRDIEAAVQAMEKRRGFRRYGLEGGERRFGVWLYSPTLNLSGKLDLASAIIIVSSSRPTRCW